MTWVSLYNAHANATVTFSNANHTTKNGLPAQYLVSKDLDPKLLQDTQLFAKESFIITDSTISLLTQN